jgi:integrase/recombinase XerD
MQKPKVTLAKCLHKEKSVVKIVFDRNEEILSRLRKLDGLRWSQTLRSWYAPFGESLVNELFILLKPVAYIDYSDIQKQDRERNFRPVASTTGEFQHKTMGQGRPAVKALGVLNEKQVEKLKRFTSWMRSRRYSESTVATYADALTIFLRYFEAKPPEQISNDDLIHFNNHYILANHLSASYQNQIINGVKLFFQTQERRVMKVDLIHRPKRAKVLPNVLSKEEVKLILNALNNLKHKAMLSLIYACGLRCGELLRLKPEHLDEKRKLLIVKQAKGKKDRIVPLSDKVTVLLLEHLRIQCSDHYLFEGQMKGQMYDERSLQQVLKNAVTKAAIRKPVTLHWLRHSYATHLLENGTDLRYIQELLGHSRSTTTEIYTHVSNRELQRIISPFDTL